MMEEFAFSEIFKAHHPDQEALLPILQDIQARYHYIPKPAFREISDYLDLPLTRVYAVTTFYNSFSLVPQGKYIIQVCLGTACHVRKAPGIVDEIEGFLKIKSGETTRDNLFTLHTVNCLGACALGPVMLINGEYHGNLKPQKIRSILEDLH